MKYSCELRSRLISSRHILLRTTEKFGCNYCHTSLRWKGYRGSKRISGKGKAVGKQEVDRSGLKDRSSEKRGIKNCSVQLPPSNIESLPNTMVKREGRLRRQTSALLTSLCGSMLLVSLRAQDEAIEKLSVAKSAASDLFSQKAAAASKTGPQLFSDDFRGGISDKPSGHDNVGTEPSVEGRLYVPLVKRTRTDGPVYGVDVSDARIARRKLESEGVDIEDCEYLPVCIGHSGIYQP